MKKYIVGIDGMMCQNCEAHMSKAIEENFDVKKVQSSHEKKQSVIIAEDIDEDKLKSVIDETGYKFVSLEIQPYKKGIFSVFGK